MSAIQETIRQLEAARDRATALIEGLREFDAGLTSGTVATETPPAIEPAREDARPTARPTKAKASRPPGKFSRVATPLLYAAVAKLREPFSAADLSQAAKADLKQCQDFLRNGAGRSLFARQARGMFVRAKRFAHRDLVPAKAAKVKRKPAAREDACPTPVKANGTAHPNGQVNGSVVTKLDKPDSVAGAIKFLLRGEQQFTRAELDANLEADPDFKALLETSPGAGDTALSAWIGRGLLTKEGRGSEAQFTVTEAGREWFGVAA